jgi:hypothetical protein
LSRERVLGIGGYFLPILPQPTNGAIRRAQELDRGRIRQHATEALSTENMRDFLVATLEYGRWLTPPE